MVQHISENAEKLLGKLVALGQKREADAYVEDEVLWDAANLSYEEYVDAADELVVGGLAESKANASDFPFLRATPEGRGRIREV